MKLGLLGYILETVSDSAILLMLKMIIDKNAFIILKAYYLETKKQKTKQKVNGILGKKRKWQKSICWSTIP